MYILLFLLIEGISKNANETGAANLMAKILRRSARILHYPLVENGLQNLNFVIGYFHDSVIGVNLYHLSTVKNAELFQYQKRIYQLNFRK